MACPKISLSLAVLIIPLAVMSLGACGSPDPVEPERYAATDRLVQVINANLSRSLSRATLNDGWQNTIRG